MPDRDKPRAVDTAPGRRAAARSQATAALHAGGDLATGATAIQVRATAVDLLRAAGRELSEADRALDDAMSPPAAAAGQPRGGRADG